MPTDLTATLAEDRPGALSVVAETLGRAGVNIDGVAMIEGTVHILVEDAARGRAALEAGGLSVASQEVLVAQPADQPGALAQLTTALAGAGVSVRFLYLGTGTRVVIGVDNLARAAAALP